MNSKCVFAIDPGDKQSAYLVYDPAARKPLDFGIVLNEKLLDIINSSGADELAIEMVASYGMPVGKSVFETCVWIGRFVECWVQARDKPFTYVYRTDVKMHLCKQTKARDSNIRQAIMDRYGSTRKEALGVKKNPGPLYGISKDVWSALAIAITHAERNDECE